MLSLRRHFVGVSLLVELSFLLTCLTHALERDISLKTLNFKLNEKFLVNHKPCSISGANVLLDDYDELDRQLVMARVMDKVDSNALLQHSIRHDAQHDERHHSDEQRIKHEKKKRKREEMTTSKWVKDWKKNFGLKHHNLAKKGNNFISCIIWDPQERAQCCKRHSKDKLQKKEKIPKHALSQYNVCMNMIKNYLKILLERGVILNPDDEETLEDELNKILAEMATKGTNSGDPYQFLHSNSKHGVEGVQPIRERSSREPKQVKWRCKQKRMVQFLSSMKRIEQLYLSDQGSSITGMGKGKYSMFMESFQECYRKKKTAVYYHTVAERWMTCGPVRFKKHVATYCADLAALSPEARELGRKPILRWESGSNEIIKDYLDLMGYWSSRSLRADEKNEDEHEVRGSVGRSVREYVDVDLFGTSSYCRTADFGNSCYAMCCDSVYGFSYLCQTDGMQCIG